MVVQIASAAAEWGPLFWKPVKGSLSFRKDPGLAHVLCAFGGAPRKWVACAQEGPALWLSCRFEVSASALF